LLHSFTTELSPIGRRLNAGFFVRGGYNIAVKDRSPNVLDYGTRAKSPGTVPIVIRIASGAAATLGWLFVLRMVVTIIDDRIHSNFRGGYLGVTCSASLFSAALTIIAIRGKISN
jgi:hypothetical protein